MPRARVRESCSAIRFSRAFIGCMGVRHEADRKAGREARFTRFAQTVEPRLRIALAAAMGPDAGADATAEANNPLRFGMSSGVIRRRAGRPRRCAL